MPSRLSRMCVLNLQKPCPRLTALLSSAKLESVLRSFVHAFESSIVRAAHTKRTAGPEILQCLKDVAAKYKLDRFLKYRHQLTRAVWDELKSIWHLHFDLLSETGEVVGTKEETADVVIQGMGGLSRWDWPDIAGLDDFLVCFFYVILGYENC